MGSGKIIIENYKGDTEEQGLYAPVVNDAFDTMCGTSGISEYAADADNECGISFFGGSKDTEFEKCLQAVDCQMHKEMKMETTADGNNEIVTFMQQMIPHHVNAVNMAKIVMKQSTQEELDAVEDFESILWNIINNQNFQIHMFRNYLNPDGYYLGDTEETMREKVIREEMKEERKEEMKEEMKEEKKEESKEEMKEEMKEETDDSAGVNLMSGLALASSVVAVSFLC